MAGYEALRESAGWLDLTGRGLIWVTGEDRARLLHAMTTNHVQQLTPGTGCYTFFLNAQGRILADANILCLEDRFLLDTEPETGRKLLEHLDRFIIADDVSLDDAGGAMAVLAVEGPGSAQVLRTAGAPVPAPDNAFERWESTLVARITVTGAPGFRMFAPAGSKDELAGRLERAGAVPAEAEAARVVRLEHGRPRYGDDISESNLVQETRRTDAIHFNKGCYIGQEIVERVRSRGHVNRLLAPLQLDGNEPPVRGAKVQRDGKDVAEITSAAWSPALGRIVALAYARAEYADRL